MTRPPPGSTPGQSRRSTSALQYFIAAACWANAPNSVDARAASESAAAMSKMTGAHGSPPLPPPIGGLFTRAPDRPERPATVKRKFGGPTIKHPDRRAAPLLAPSFRIHEALRHAAPGEIGNCLERPSSRSRQAARVHARVADAPRRGDDRDRRHRPDGGVRRRPSVAVLGVEARRPGVQGRGRLCRPDDVLRHVDQHRADHRHFGHGVARARRRRPAARTAARGVRAHHHRDPLGRDGGGDVRVARLDPDDAFARAWRIRRGRLEVHRHQHPGERAARGRHGVCRACCAPSATRAGRCT